MGNYARQKGIVAIAAEHTTDRFEGGSDEVVENYGIDTFSIKTMKNYLSKETFKSLRKTIKQGIPLDASIADEVATAMKTWALGRGATHYTHWFQPLTGTTAEKHDSFIEPDYEGGVVMDFSGKALIQGEPDASSFPNGGIRATFEARGYTAWDPTSPAFIKRDKNGATLCIPTAFCSYTGEALDQKTPLLRSIQAINHQTKRVLALFGKEVQTKVAVTLGAEQEYFLVDKRLYFTRPDLIQAGRTLFGNVPPKHQQMEDHYFGAIRPRVLDFMSDVDRTLWKLGIPAKTRHNEVAPAQFELASQFEEVNVAVDQNMMIMEVLRQTADRHGLVCLLHEKPFKGVNGSGKHNNWSLSYDGINLLEPGQNPHDNALFLTMLCSVIKAVDSYPELLRITSASAGNDHRLGAAEAPPAIISIYLGEQLDDVIDQIAKGGANSSTDGDIMNIGADILPKLPKDVTDRNRTSPFAFTGNKFEFRAVGSNMNPAEANTVLNTIVAESLRQVADALEGVDASDFDRKLQEILQESVINHRRVIFNGDNYSQEWRDEAARRGLPNLVTTKDALPHLLDEKSKDLFSRHNVLSHAELESRFEILDEQYEARNEIEAGIAVNIVRHRILPTAINVQKNLSESINALTQSGVTAGLVSLKKSSEKVGGILDCLYEAIDLLDEVRGDAVKSIPALAEVRSFVDELERIVDDQEWPLARYGELMFLI